MPSSPPDQKVVVLPETVAEAPVTVVMNWSIARSMPPRTAPGRRLRVARSPVYFVLSMPPKRTVPVSASG
jgi:hypothetical protein